MQEVDEWDQLHGLETEPEESALMELERRLDLPKDEEVE